MVNHPSRKQSPILTLVRNVFGRRHQISRDDMRAILVLMGNRQLVELGNGWGGSRPDASIDTNAEVWADACTHITIISVFDSDASLDSRLASSNPGTIRFDQPGDMHPLHQATMMFAPPGLDNDYLRRHAKRVLIVEAPEPTQAPEPEPEPMIKCECDNGHRWQTSNLAWYWACPTCGEPWE